jgi:DNA repair exonuclease SbcCD nuclease subunit
MHILHLADTHLGYSAYYKTAADGLNQREVDVYAAFRQGVDYAIKHRPDLVIHAGDLFDTVRPTNRAISMALQQFIRLSEAGIPTVLISGNHETPKLRETGSVFRLFEHLEHIFPVYRGQYETFEFGDLLVHAVPHCPTGEGLKKGLEELTPVEGKVNLLTLHVGISGIKEFRTGDFNEQVIPTGYLSSDFDYIALGHYHRSCQVSDNAYYAGSIEHLSFKEADDAKGVLTINTEGPEVAFLPLPVRPMLDLATIDCSHMNGEAVTQHIIDSLQATEIEGAVVRVVLKDIPRNVYKGLDVHTIRTVAAPALHFEIAHDIKELKHELASTGRIGSLVDEWKEYMARVAVEGNKKVLEQLALQYLSEASS